MALTHFSSFTPKSQKTPLWMPFLLTCFLLQTLIPNGYMPGNLSSGQGALVFCGDTSFLDPHAPDISELLEESQPSGYGTAHGYTPHSDPAHSIPAHNNAFSEFSHCLFSLGGQVDQAEPVLVLYTGQYASEYGPFPSTINVSSTEPDYIRPLLRAPPHLAS
jgi:hypothetical protein